MEQNREILVEKLGEVIFVPRHLIRPFPGQPREYFDNQKLIELSSSMKAIGQKVPGFVKEISDHGSPYRYELIDGQRRWYALEMADMPKMKVIILQIKDIEEQFLISVVTNFGRAEHGPLEIAKAIQRFRNNGISITDTAKIFAKSQGWVNQHLKILQLDPEVQGMMSPEIPDENRLVFSVALMIADCPQDLQKMIAKQIVGSKMKMGQARNLIRKRAEKLGFRFGSPDRSPRHDYRNLCSLLGKMKRELEIFDEMPQGFFDKMFQFRQEEDYTKIVITIENNIKRLKNLLLNINRVNKKSAKIA